MSLSHHRLPTWLRPAAAAAALILAAGCSSSKSAAPSATSPGTTTATTATSATAGSNAPGDSTVPASTAGTATASTVATTPPPAPIETVAVKDSVLDVIGKTPELSNFATLVAAPGMATVFTQSRGVTVFAPDNTALSAPDAAALLTDQEKLALFLSRHLLIGSKTLDQLGTSVTMASGQTFTIDPAAKTVGGVTIVKADITATNGTIHEIDAVLPAS